MDELRSVPQGKALKISVEPGSGVTVDSIAAAVTILARERNLNLIIACGEWCLHVGKISDALDGGVMKNLADCDDSGQVAASCGEGRATMRARSGRITSADGNSVHSSRIKCG